MKTASRTRRGTPKARRRAVRPVTDAYLALTREFPLRPIRSDAEYDAAAAVVDRLAVEPEGALAAGEQDYLDTLTLLIQAYDDEHFDMMTGKLSGVDALKYMMEQAGMRRIDLGRLLGNVALATFILNGEREMSKTHIRILAKHFKVDASLFLEGN